MLTIIILLFGLIGYNTLGVREYPSVDNPIISVTCSYSGANADVIENQITEPLEQNINGIPGIRSLSSVSQQGQCRITVEFELSVDLETAANDVRDKVSRAQRYLPRDCDPPTVSKADADATPILMVAIQSDSRSLLELSEIADLTVKERLRDQIETKRLEKTAERRLRELRREAITEIRICPRRTGQLVFVRCHGVVRIDFGGDCLYSEAGSFL